MRRKLLCILSCITSFISAQTTEILPFGDFEQWLVREIKESVVLGGKVKTVYAIAPSDTIRENKPYTNTISPWTSSNVMAVVMGITKTSNTVFPEQREGKGFSVRMETSLVECKVIGLFNIKVLASGSILLGCTQEPITSTNNPYGNFDMGIPFSKCPQKLLFDYKSKIDQSGELTKATGLSTSKLKGDDYGQVLVFLQKRHEDEKGAITAQRIATANIYIKESSNGWINNHAIELIYGDATKSQEFNSGMSLTDIYYAKNSKGKMVQITEIGWANEGTAPTHLVMMFSSGSQGAYIGSLGNTLSVDNIKLQY